MPSKTEILEQTKKIMQELFELDEEQLVPEAKLYEDLDIDSIDAVDLLIELKKFSGKNIEPDRFKDVKTLDDIVNTVAELAA
ncbi:MAG: acyl carrier protein [Cellvibrionaceae bacterium]